MALRFLSCLFLLGWAAAAVAEPTVRVPTAKWVVDFDAAKCVASRTYGSAEKPLHLVLKAPPLGGVMQISIMRKGGSASPEQVDATIGTDERAPLRTNMLMFGPKNSGLRVYVLNMPEADFSLVRAGKRLSIRSPGLNETFALSDMEPLLKIMDECVVDLRKVWNVGDSEGEQSPIPVRATGDTEGLLKSDDYPGVAADENQSGSVKIAMLIDESGRVADCTVIETSGVAALDAQTCALMKGRAKFTPGRGVDGKPAKDAIVKRVTWRLQG